VIDDGTPVFLHDPAEARPVARLERQHPRYVPI
jgi:hypothetical protein